MMTATDWKGVARSGFSVYRDLDGPRTGSSQMIEVSLVSRSSCSEGELLCQAGKIHSEWQWDRWTLLQETGCE